MAITITVNGMIMTGKRLRDLPFTRERGKAAFA